MQAGIFALFLLSSWEIISNDSCLARYVEMGDYFLCYLKGVKW